MRKKSFFDNLGAILAYALLGTIISTAIIALGDHPYIKSGLFWIHPSTMTRTTRICEG